MVLRQLDLKLDYGYKDSFLHIEMIELSLRLDQLLERSKIINCDPAAPIVYLLFEAEGELLPYFLNEPKTAFGFMHQGTLYQNIPHHFRDKQTKRFLEKTVTKIQNEQEYRDSTYSIYDSNLRSNSLVEDIDLADLLFSGSDHHAIANLQHLQTICKKENKPAFDCIALGYLYIISRNYDVVKFFTIEKGIAGITKRNNLSEYTGTGEMLQERVFRSLLDYGKYFEDKYSEFLNIFPTIPSRIVN